MKPFSFGDKIGLLRGGQNRSGRKDSARPFARLMTALGMTVMLAGCNPATDDKIVTPDQLPYSQILAENKTEYSKKIEAQADRFAQFPVPVVFLDEDAITLAVILDRVDPNTPPVKIEKSRQPHFIRDQLVRQTGYDFAAVGDSTRRYSSLAVALRDYPKEGWSTNIMRLPARFERGADYKGTTAPKRLCAAYGASADRSALQQAAFTAGFSRSTQGILNPDALPTRAEWAAFETYRQAALCQADQFLGQNLSEAGKRGWAAQHQAQVFADSFAALQMVRDGHMDALAGFRDLRAVGTLMGGWQYVTLWPGRSEQDRMLGMVMHTSFALNAVIESAQEDAAAIAAMDDVALLQRAEQLAHQYAMTPDEMQAVADDMWQVWKDSNGFWADLSKAKSETLRKLHPILNQGRLTRFLEGNVGVVAAPHDVIQLTLAEVMQEYIKREGGDPDALARFITTRRDKLRMTQDKEPQGYYLGQILDELRSDYGFERVYNRAIGRTDPGQSSKDPHFGPRR